MKKLSLALFSLALLLFTTSSGLASVIGSEDVTLHGSVGGSWGWGSVTFVDSEKGVPGVLSLMVQGQSTFGGVSGITGAKYNGAWGNSDYLMHMGGLKGVYGVDFRTDGIYKFALLEVLGGPDKTWHLELSKINTPQPASTPLPAAVWLFGSGLVGLFGLRKKLKA